MARFFREEFDRGREFEVERGFTFDSVAYIRGQRVDKTKFTLRRLRQLFDQRRIRFRAVQSEPEPPPPEPKAEQPKPRVERYRRVGA